jgi:hypothetical protein
MLNSSPTLPNEEVKKEEKSQIKDLEQAFSLINR